MTIFLKIVKKYLVEEITKVRDKSVEADKGLGNSVLTQFGYGRDPELAKSKRDLADLLLTQLRCLEDKEDDHATCTELRRLISECKRQAKVASDNKSYPEGSFGPAMVAAMYLVQAIYDKLEEVELINLEHDEDALNKFRFHMALYFSKKIVDAQNVGLINTIISNPLITAGNKVAREKEKLALEMLRGCIYDLSTLDADHEDYAVTRKARVLEWIEKISRRNRAVCQEHSTKVSIPVSLNFFSTVHIGTPSLGPEVGFLESCLQLAIVDIQPSKPEEVKAASV